jgi:transcriptional regulatory protein LevR/transcriptional regulator with AAA-type ATPase domain
MLVITQIIRKEQYQVIRKDKVYMALEEACEEYSDYLDLNNLEEERIGLDTTKISELTGILRNNISKELNQLVKEKKVIKFIDYPARYIPKTSLEEIIGREINSGNLVVNSIKELYPTDIKIAKPEDDIFHSMIGYNSSLQLPIKQAKAAVFYPPNGLHILLVGPTGIGKTTFAELIYKYAKSIGTIPPDAEFVCFNCAEYAENPQLLVSHLFGYTKGAFTGAERDNPGLIEQSKNGILLLDEVHRLSPEGQEMLFMLMDKKKYRRVGETSTFHYSNVLIIAATTEKTDSVLLQTFLRRIPMLIKVPSLQEKSLSERLQLIQYLFSIQSKLIGEDIRVTRDVIKSLLLYQCEGNIGQLKADIQLTCASGLLEYKTSDKKLIELDTQLIPEHVYRGLFTRRNDQNTVNKILGNTIFFNYRPDLEALSSYESTDYEYGDVYGEILEKYKIYSEKGYSQQKIRDTISIIISNYVKSLLQKVEISNEDINNHKLFKLVQPQLYYAIKEGLAIVGELLGRDYGDKYAIALSMHIVNLFQRSNSSLGEETTLENIAVNFPNEYKGALVIKQQLEKKVNLILPDSELRFIAMLLNTESHKLSSNLVGIIVICHGRNTATSIAEVCNELLKTNRCHAINMLLDKSMDETYSEVMNLVKDIDKGKGILFLVDMGSLVAFGQSIEKNTGIKIKTIDMVSTPLALEAVRKSELSEMSLEVLYEELIKIHSVNTQLLNCNRLEGYANDLSKNTIITTCITSEGTAKKLVELIKNTIPFLEENNIIIKPLKIAKIEKLSDYEMKKIIAFTGTINPEISGIPFISTKDLLINNGFEQLHTLIFGRTAPRLTIPNFAYGMIEDSLTFLDLKRVYEPLNLILDKLIVEKNIKKSNSLKAAFLMHCPIMLERIIRNNTISYDEEKLDAMKKRKTFKIIKDSFRDIEETLQIDIPDTEIAYLVDMVDTI